MNTTPAPLTAEREAEIRTNLFRSQYARDTEQETAACYEADVSALLAELDRRSGRSVAARCGVARWLLVHEGYRMAANYTDEEMMSDYFRTAPALVLALKDADTLLALALA